MDFKESRKDKTEIKFGKSDELRLKRVCAKKKKKIYSVGSFTKIILML